MINCLLWALFIFFCMAFFPVPFLIVLGILVVVSGLFSIIGPFLD